MRCSRHIGCIYAVSFRLYSVIQTCRHRDTLEHHYCTRNMQLRKPLSHPNQESGGRRGRESMFSPVSPWLYKRHVLKINPAVKRVCVCVCESMHVCADGQIHTQPGIHVHRLIWLNANTNTHCVHAHACELVLSVVAKETQLSSAEKEQSSGSTHIHTPAFQDTFWIQYANTLNMIVCKNVYTR